MRPQTELYYVDTIEEIRRSAAKITIIGVPIILIGMIIFWWICNA